MKSFGSFIHNTVFPLVLVTRLMVFIGDVPVALAVDPHSPFNTANTNQQVFSQEDFLRLTNAAREDVGLSELSLNDRLSAAAQAKVRDMVNNGYWDHFRPTDHKAPWTFIREAGYDYTIAGENLARGYRTPQGITRAWLASPTHRANILSPKYTEVGFASMETFDAQGAPVVLTVQMFGGR